MRGRHLIIPLLLLLLFLCGTASAEKAGRTKYVLQPAPEGAGKVLYVLFPGSTEMYSACRTFKDLTADDGLLLLSQPPERKPALADAWKPLIEDISPIILDYARQEYDIRIIGFSAGGYPAVTIATALAEEGFSGTLWLLDGVPKPTEEIEYTADFFREHFSSWQLYFCIAGKDNRDITVRTGEVAAILADDENVTVASYAFRHSRLLSPMLETILHHAPEPKRMEP